MKKINFITLLLAIAILLSGCTHSDKPSIESSSHHEPATDSAVVPVWVDKIKSVKNIYETNRFIYYLSADGVYRYEKSTCENELLIDNSNISSFVLDETGIYYCVDGGYDYYYNIISCIYYFSFDDKTSVIALNYSDVEEYMISDSLNHFFVNNGVIYVYSSGTSLIEYAGSASRFVDDLSSGTFFNGDFYYIDHAERTQFVYKKSTGNENTVFRSDLNYDSVFAFDKYLFLVSKYPAGIYMMSNDGTQRVCNLNLSSDSLEFSVSYGGAIYLLSNDTVYKYSPTDDTCVEIAKNPGIYSPKPFKVIDGYLIYDDDNSVIAYTPIN